MKLKIKVLLVSFFSVAFSSEESSTHRPYILSDGTSIMVRKKVQVRPGFSVFVHQVPSQRRGEEGLAISEADQSPLHDGQSVVSVSDSAPPSHGRNRQADIFRDGNLPGYMQLPSPTHGNVIKWLNEK